MVLPGEAAEAGRVSGMVDVHRELGCHPQMCEAVLSVNRSLRAIMKEERRRRPSRSELLAEAYTSTREFFGTPRDDLVRHVVPTADVEVTAYSVPTWVLNLARVRLERITDACYFVEETLSGSDRVPPRVDRGHTHYSDYAWAYATLLNWRLLSQDPDGPNASNLRYKTAGGVQILAERLNTTWEHAQTVVLLSATIKGTTLGEVLARVSNGQVPDTIAIQSADRVEMAVDRQWLKLRPPMFR